MVLTKPFPKIEEMLFTLQSQKIKLAVLSNKEDRLTKKMVKHYFLVRIHYIFVEMVKIFNTQHIQTISQ